MVQFEQVVGCQVGVYFMVDLYLVGFYIFYFVVDDYGWCVYVCQFFGQCVVVVGGCQDQVVDVFFLEYVQVVGLFLWVVVGVVEDYVVVVVFVVIFDVL